VRGRLGLDLLHDDRPALSAPRRRHEALPEDLASPREVHADGEIWSRALWDIRQALGAPLADTIIIRAQFDFAVGTTMPTAAKQSIATAGQYGRTAQRAVTAAFAARGLA
jgi:zinc metalloprotease ZmpB